MSEAFARAGPPVAEGRVDEGIHKLPVRVYYEDTDFSGVVYHANYVRYLERGRSDFLRLAGVRHADLARLEEPLGFSITELSLRFHKPARIDDWLEVRTVFSLVRGPRILAHQAVVRPGEALLVRAEVHAACIAMTGQPRRLPKWAVECLAPYCRAEPENWDEP
jgi:acyl-CoA thioester hydrolase